MLGYVAQMNIFSDISNAINNVINFFQHGIWEQLSQGGLTLIDHCYKGASAGADLVLKYNDLNDSIYNTLWELAQKVYNSLAVIGVGLCLMFWLIGIVDKLTKDKMTLEIFIRCFVELIAALVVVLEGFDTFKWIANIGTEISTYVAQGQTATTTPTDTPKEVYEAFCFGISYNDLTTNATPGSFLVSIIGGIVSVFFWLFSNIVYAYCSSIVIARVIQTSVYLAMAPIAASQMFNRGSILDSSAMSFIKKLAALSLQGPIIVFVMAASNAVSSQAGTAAGFSIVILIAVKLVTLSLCSKSNSFANDIIA